MKLPKPLKEKTDTLPHDEPTDGGQTEPGKVSEDNKGKKTDSPNVGKEVIGVAAGSAAVVGLAVIEAPVVVAAGVGFAVWIAARTLLLLGS